MKYTTKTIIANNYNNTNNIVTLAILTNYSYGKLCFGFYYLLKQNKFYLFQF